MIVDGYSNDKYEIQFKQKKIDNDDIDGYV